MQENVKQSECTRNSGFYTNFQFQFCFFFLLLISTSSGCVSLNPWSLDKLKCVLPGR